MRFLGAVLAGILASSLGTLVACSATEKDEPVPTKEAVSTASVKIALMDANGTRIGDASGVLIAPRLVLTAGHSIAGKYKWEITSADGKQKVLGTRGLTYDWMTYDSMNAHPRRHDVGVIHLDAPIKLAAYPKLVSDRAVDNMTATRVRGTGGSFEMLPVLLKKVATSPNNLLAEIKGAETLDTGGAVYDERGIIGVVSGRGLTTGNLYVARTDKLNTWLSSKVVCAGGSTFARTYAAPAKDKSAEICDDAGNPISSSGNPSGNPSGGENPNGNPPNNDGSCSDNNDGVCSGAGCGTGGTNGTTPNGSGDDDDDDNGNSSGGNGKGDGSSGSSGSNPNDPNGAPNGGPNANLPGGPSGNPPTGQSSGQTGKPQGGGGTNGISSSSGDNGGTNGGGPSGRPNGQSGSSGGGAGTNHSDGETCQGASDNPELCPPEPDGCSGAGCGGGFPDGLIDYGNCACGARGDEDPVKVR